MTRSENINELAKALSLFQSELKGAQRNADNPFFQMSYADLGAIWESIRAPLGKSGLSVCQTTEILNERLILNTLLMHSSGQWISSQYPIDPPKRDPQGFGSAMSYARRYTLAAIIGAYQKDDDGEAAVRQEPPPKEKPVAKIDPLDSLRKKLFAVAHDQKYTDDDLKTLVKATYPTVKSRADLSKAQMDFLILYMKENPKDKPTLDDDEKFPFEK